MITQRKYRSLVKVALNSLDIPVARNNSLHFTFIIRRNNILSIGYNNMSKTNPYAKKAGYWYGVIHSEFDAIRRFPLPPEKLSDCELVNIRSNRHGCIMNSQPCDICSTLILPFNFRAVYFSLTESEYEKAHCY
jgi:tRNA(Arg) A34 adenosine deaminase TadA